MEEKFREHCSSSSSKKSRFNFAIVATLLASICFLTLRFSPSFLTLLLLLIPSFLFLTYKKSDSKRHPLISAADHHLCDEIAQRTAEERSAAVIGEARSSEDERSSNGGLGSSVDAFEHHLFDEMPLRTEKERSAALIGEERSFEDESSSNGGLGRTGDDFDLLMFEEMPQRTAEERSAALIVEERSSEDESCSNGGSRSSRDIDSDLWMCLDELARNPPFSDDSSFEDDDSLIEIPILPTIRTDSNRESVRNLKMCLPDLLTDSALKQHGFTELLEEINEEDNLIEIDISRGFNRVCTACN